MENINSEDFNLTEEEINTISALDKGSRFNNPPDVCAQVLILIFWKEEGTIQRHREASTGFSFGTPVFVYF